eukprot:scaffold59141_cov37-Tisochrysis_lutea.AAC.3
MRLSNYSSTGVWGRKGKGHRISNIEYEYEYVLDRCFPGFLPLYFVFDRPIDEASMWSNWGEVKRESESVKCKVRDAAI